MSLSRMNEIRSFVDLIHSSFSISKETGKSLYLSMPLHWIVFDERVRGSYPTSWRGFETLLVVTGIYLTYAYP